MTYRTIFTRGRTLPRQAVAVWRVPHAEVWPMYGDFVACGPVRLSLEAAARDRSMSGDLVVEAATFAIVQSDAWLFEWEKTRPDCYARLMMARDKEAA